MLSPPADDWEIRARFIGGGDKAHQDPAPGHGHGHDHGGEDSDEEERAREAEEVRRLRALVPGKPKSVKNIQLMWEEMHATNQLTDFGLLRPVHPDVLAAILPAWHPDPAGRQANESGMLARRAEARNLASALRRQRGPSGGGELPDAALPVLPPPTAAPVDGAIPEFNEDIPTALLSISSMHAAEALAAEEARKQKHHHSHHHHHNHQNPGHAI